MANYRAICLGRSSPSKTGILYLYWCLSLLASTLRFNTNSTLWLNYDNLTRALNIRLETSISNCQFPHSKSVMVWVWNACGIRFQSNPSVCPHTFLQFLVDWAFSLVLPLFSPYVVLFGFKLLTKLRVIEQLPCQK